LRIVIELKRGVITKVVLNQLFSRTALQSSFGVINLALVNGRPEVLSLKALIKHFVEHRKIVITRRTQFELKKAEERAHILRALIIAIQNIDEVIKIIRASRNTDTAKAALMTRFSFDDVQAQAIVDMQLKRLTSLEIETLTKELEELEVLITHLKDLLAHPEKMFAIIKNETNELAEKFGDERRTDIVTDEVEQINVEDLIREEEMVILISKMGYIKRQPVTAYKNQGRGGKGIMSAKLAEEDFVNQIFIASTHDKILFITTEGKAYWVKVHEITETGRTSRGTHIKSLLEVSSDEEISSVVSLKEFRDDQYIFMATAGGVVKKVPTDVFRNAKTRGILALKLDSGDKLVSSVLSNGTSDLLLITRKGVALRYNEDEVRPMGRSSRGVRGINLKNGDELAAAQFIDNSQKLLIVSENGYGKRVDYSEINPHGRGTGGQRLYKVTEKTGEIVGAIGVAENDDVMCITSQGKTLRLIAKKIGEQGKNASGVRVLDIEPPDIAIGVDRIINEGE
jgi:DNA gyrase subunit A